MILAVLLMVVAMTIPFLSPRVQGDPTLSRALGPLLVLRQLVSAAQVYWGGLPTVNADPITFHTACATGVGPAIREPYGVFLSFFYNTFEPSHLLGCELSQVAFSLALLAEIELFYLFGLEKHASKLVLVFGLLPSVLLNTSVTMREPFQMMAFLWLTVGLVRLLRDGFSFFSLAAIPSCMVLLFFLHQGFALFIILLIPLSVLVVSRKRPEILVLTSVVALVAFVGLGGKVWKIMTARSQVIERIDSGHGLEYIGGYQESVERGRSDFETLLSLESPGAALKTGPIVLLNYFLSPLPWQIRGLLDAYGFAETVVRAALLWGLILGLKKSQTGHRDEQLLLLGIYLLVEVMWAAGTANWGTAFRHRVVGYGLLVVLGAMGWLQSSAAESSQVSAKPSSLRARIRATRKKRKVV